jgi:hypothetical protein
MEGNDDVICTALTLKFLEKPTIGLLCHALYLPTFLASLRHADPTMFLWFQAFSPKVECSVSTLGFGQQTSGNS